jgi:hypothetical protein
MQMIGQTVLLCLTACWPAVGLAQWYDSDINH